jgi:hypothetical protein
LLSSYNLDILGVTAQPPREFLQEKGVYEMASMSLQKLRDRVVKLQHNTAKAREKAGQMMEVALTTAESSGTAFALGLWAGSVEKDKHFEVAGVPVPLLVGLGAHGFALFGVGRGMDAHFHAVGNGALSAHLFGVGMRVAAERKAKNAGVISATSVPVLPAAAPKTSGIGVSQDDLINLVRASRA